LLCRQQRIVGAKRNHSMVFIPLARVDFKAVVVLNLRFL
jgi:hypothetical protein